MKTQAIFTCLTDDLSMRSPIQGWTFESPSEVQFAHSENRGSYSDPNSIPVGLIRSGLRYYPSYPTVLHALGDGWRLLAPPQQHTETSSEGVEYKVVKWWLVRDE